MIEILELFIGEVPKLLKSLNEESCKQNKEETSKYCHKIKGSIGNFAVFTLYQQFQELEVYSKSGQWVKFDKLYADAESNLQELIVESNVFLSQ